MKCSVRPCAVLQSVCIIKEGSQESSTSLLHSVQLEINRGNQENVSKSTWREGGRDVGV